MLITTKSLFAVLFWNRLPLPVLHPFQGESSESPGPAVSGAELGWAAGDLTHLTSRVTSRSGNLWNLPPWSYFLNRRKCLLPWDSVRAFWLKGKEINLMTEED